MTSAVIHLFLTPAEAARYLRLSVKTLERYRQEGTGPAFIKLGRHILYSKQELDRYVAERTFRSTAEYHAIKAKKSKA